MEATAFEVLVLPIFWGMLGSCGVGVTALLCMRLAERIAGWNDASDSGLDDSRGVGLEQLAVRD
jgi:hypothetical protein